MAGSSRMFPRPIRTSNSGPAHLKTHTHPPMAHEIRASDTDKMECLPTAVYSPPTAISSVQQPQGVPTQAQPGLPASVLTWISSEEGVGGGDTGRRLKWGGFLRPP